MLEVVDFLHKYDVQVVYILDQVRALENEMLLRIQKQGLDVKPRILIVSVFLHKSCYFSSWENIFNKYVVS